MEFALSMYGSNARQYERDLERMPVSPVRTEFAVWMHQRELDRRLEIEERQLMKKREEWHQQLINATSGDVPSEPCQNQLPRDDRMLPHHGWHSIYHRFSRRHNFLLGRDQAGCNDEDDAGTGTRGITVDIYNGLTGTFVCTVDVGIDDMSQCLFSFDPILCRRHHLIQGRHRDRPTER